MILLILLQSRFLFFRIGNNSNFVFHVQKLVFVKTSVFKKMSISASIGVSIFKFNNLLKRELDLLLAPGLAIVCL